MTNDEAYAAGWHAAWNTAVVNEDVWVDGIKETQPLLNNDRPAEIKEDEALLAAWQRGFDEGRQARFDERYPPE